MKDLKDSPFPSSVSLAADLLGIEVGEAQAALLYLAADIALANKLGKANDNAITNSEKTNKKPEE